MSNINRIFGSGFFRVIAVLSVSCWITVAQAKPQGTLSVGVCKQDITPVSPGLSDEYEDLFGEAKPVNHTDPIYLAGFDNDRQATGYNDRLWARGVVIDGRGGRIALVALDFVGYWNNQIEIVREMVGDDVDYLIVQSSHSHEGPDTVGLWGPNELTSGVDPGYLEFVNDAIADCVTEASNNMQPARIKSVTASTEGLSLGIHRDDDGFGVADQKVLEGDDILSPETNGRIVDSNLVVMQFTELKKKKKVIATLVNFGSHPEVLWSENTMLTSDFPHYVRERLEQEYGGTAIWVSGAVGVLQGPDRIDVSEDGINPVEPKRSFQFAEVHGTQLAERAIATVDKKPGHPAPVVAYARQNPVAVPLENGLFRFFFAAGVLGNGRTLYTDGEPDASVGFPFAEPFDGIPQALGEDLQTEVGVARIGDAGLIVVPTELDPQIGMQYREAMTAVRDKFIVGLGNDHIGYQVLESKFDRSCMECAPFVLGGIPEECPLYPNIDCSTVFSNNVGPSLSPSISGALLPLIEQINNTKP
jgi:hypothetical protein